MAVEITSTGITFPGGSTQTTSTTGTSDYGKLLSISTYSTAGSYQYNSMYPEVTTAGITWTASSVTVGGSNPYTLTPTSAPSSWTISAYSTESGVNVAAVAKPDQTNKYMMFGLTSAPGSSYTNIDYALYWNADGTVQIYESGSYIGSYGAYNSGWIGRVTYDGNYIRYYADRNGTRPIRIVSQPITKNYRFQAAFYNGGSMSGVGFGACTNTQATRVVAKVSGAGGGAAGYCESGGAGGYAEVAVDGTQATMVAVTVGGGGAGVSYYAAGGTGGTSSFGGYCSATGGGGSNSYSAHSSGFGGVGTGGDVNLRGGGGCGHVNSVGSHSGGRGGGGYWGGGGPFNRATATKVYNGAPGSGGAGGLTDQNNTGGGGEAGLVVVYTYK